MKRFVDTNILVYAEDLDAGRRHEVARDLIVELWGSGDGVLSIQVLQEFFVTVTRKLKKPLPHKRATEIVRQYLTWHVVENRADLLVDSMALQRKAKLSFWDALIVQAAISAGCDVLYTEDLNDGQRFGSLEIVDPFRVAR